MILHKFVQMKGHALFPGETIATNSDWDLKIGIPLQNHWNNFKHLKQKYIQICSNIGQHPFPKEDNTDILKRHWRILRIFSSRTKNCSNFNQTLQKASLCKGNSMCLNKDNDKIMIMYWQLLSPAFLNHFNWISHKESQGKGN